MAGLEQRLFAGELALHLGMSQATGVVLVEEECAVQ